MSVAHEDSRALSLSRDIHSCGDEWAGCGPSLAPGLAAALICRSCLTWLKTVDALLPLLHTCQAWRSALQKQIEAGDVYVYLSLSCIDTLSRLAPKQRALLVSELARCARSSLYVDFAVCTPSSSVPREMAVTAGRELFSEMPFACELSIDLEAWTLPLGGFVLELCRLIGRSGAHLDTLQLRGTLLHCGMRDFLVSGCRVDLAFKPNKLHNIGSNISIAERTDNRNELILSQSPSVSQNNFSEFELSPPLASTSAVAPAESTETAAPEKASEEVKGRMSKTIPFVLPCLKHLSLDGFQLLEFFEARQLEEHFITLTPEMVNDVRFSSSVQYLGSGSGSLPPLSGRNNRGSMRSSCLKYMGNEISFIHPCLAVRFVSLNGAHMRSMEVAGFVAPLVRGGIIRWVRRALACPQGSPRASGSSSPERMAEIKKNACLDFCSNEAKLQCHECVALDQSQTGADAWNGCSMVPKLERLRVDDMFLLAFVSAPKLEQLEVCVSSSGEWPLLLAFLRTYGAHLRRLCVWAEDLLPLWLSTCAYSDGGAALASCRASAETLLLMSFLQRKARYTGNAADGTTRKVMHQTNAGAKLDKSSLPLLSCLTCPSCLLRELSPSHHSLPSLSHLDTWGDSSRLVDFLEQRHMLQSVRVRGLTYIDETQWPEGYFSKDEGAAPSADFVLALQKRESWNRSALSVPTVREASRLEQYTGPGLMLIPSLRCPQLRRVELTEQAEKADEYLLSGGAPQLEVLLYGGRLAVNQVNLKDAAFALGNLKVLHALVLDTANITVNWGVSEYANAGKQEGLLSAESGNLEKQQTTGKVGATFLANLEQLYVHRLVAVPKTFLQYLSAAGHLRLIGLQRCEGVSIGAVVSTLESRGFRRLEQDNLPNPECRAFASSVSRGGVSDRFVVLKRDEGCSWLDGPEEDDLASASCA